MSLRSLAMVCGVVGGVSWLSRLVLEQADAGGEGLLDGLYWAGLALLGIALFGFGAGLVSRSAHWLQAIVGIALALLIWSVVEVFHDAGNPTVIDGVVGGVIAVLAIATLSRRSDGHQNPARRAHGAHAR
jgi:uncharacterized membrane protein YccC